MKTLLILATLVLSVFPVHAANFVDDGCTYIQLKNGHYYFMADEPDVGPLLLTRKDVRKIDAKTIEVGGDRFTLSGSDVPPCDE